VVSGVQMTEVTVAAPRQTLFVRMLTGQSVPVQVAEDDTIAAVKEHIARSEGIPASEQKLLFSGRVLEDQCTVAHYNIGAESTVHLVTAPTPEASTAAPKFRTWKLNELIDKGQFTLGKKLGMGATNIANVVTVEGVRYAGKRIVALSDSHFRETYGLNSKEQIEMLMRPEGVLTKLDRELDLLKHLDHPNIIALPGVIYEDVEGVTIPMYCLQELGEGGALDVKLGTGPIAMPTARSYLHEMLAAVVYLHRENVLHRDLKPANVLLDASHEHVKLCDFGEARNNIGSTMTTSGTPVYMAPEVSSGYYSDKADIYSLGVMAMEMCGVKPMMTHEERTTLFTTKENESNNIAGSEFGRVLCTTWNTDPAMRPGAEVLLGALDGDFSQVPPTTPVTNPAPAPVPSILVRLTTLEQTLGQPSTGSIPARLRKAEELFELPPTGSTSERLAALGEAL